MNDPIHVYGSTHRFYRHSVDIDNQVQNQQLYGLIFYRSPVAATLGLNWLEEPSPFEDESGSAKIAANTPKISIVGYETAQGCQNFHRLIEKGTMDIVQPDVGWGGGITELRRICSSAAAAAKPVSLHSFGSAVHFAASLHLAASLPNTAPIESEENPNELKTGLLTTPFETDRNMNYFVPQSPGLGIDLDWDKIESYCIMK